MSRAVAGGECCKDIVCEECPVLLYIDSRRRFVFRVRRGGVQGSDRGVLRHDDILGLPYGSKIRLSSGVEAYLLKPFLLDMVERGFQRKSQVIYPKDHGMIMYLAGIGPGSRVVEVGMGSGFTTVFLAHVVGESGRVYSYETREDMVRVAMRNLEMAGLADRVVVRLRDARLGIEEECVDAVIADIPDPWNIVDHVYRALRGSGAFVAFMPAINQVVRFLAVLSVEKVFLEPRVVEVSVREYQPVPDALRPYSTGVIHTGYLVATRKVVEPGEKVC